jgi:hypothetical protein
VGLWEKRLFTFPAFVISTASLIMELDTVSQFLGLYIVYYLGLATYLHDRRLRIPGGLDLLRGLDFRHRLAFRTALAFRWCPRCEFCYRGLNSSTRRLGAMLLIGPAGKLLTLIRLCCVKGLELEYALDEGPCTREI